MKLKLDENLGRRGVDMLREAGHDVLTVTEEDLLAASDIEILHRCRLEDRALITLDRGLANPVAHNPADYAGIIVLRLPRKPKRIHLSNAVRAVVAGLKQNEPAHSLWLVRAGRIRIFKQGQSDD